MVMVGWWLDMHFVYELSVREEDGLFPNMFEQPLGLWVYFVRTHFAGRSDRMLLLSQRGNSFAFVAQQMIPESLPSYTSANTTFSMFYGLNSAGYSVT
jgi:hypothetical protein